MNAATHYFTLALPGCSVCVLTILPLCFPPEVQAIYPDVIWLFLCIFGIYAPPLMPMTLLFILSLGIDILTDTILGVHSVILLILWAIIQVQRRFLYVRSFLSLWGVFVFMTLLNIGLNTAAEMILTPDTNLSFFRLTQIFMGFLTTILAFPGVFYWMMTILRKIA